MMKVNTLLKQKGPQVSNADPDEKLLRKAIREWTKRKVISKTSLRFR